MQLNLDLTQCQPEKDSKVDLLPAGDYLGKITEVDCKETKGKTGWLLVLYFLVMEGEHAGKTFCDNLNIANANADAQRISLSRLKGILEKTGYANPNHLSDTDHMVGMTLIASLVQEKYTTQSGNEVTSNKVKKYAAAGASSPGGTVVAIPAAAPIQPAAPAVAAAPSAPVASAAAGATGAAAPTTSAAPAAGAFPWGTPN